jgi:predicted transposase YdaD
VVKAMKAKGNPEILEMETAARTSGQEEGRIEGEAKGRAEGEAIGMVKAILKMLEARGIAVSPAQREEIGRCSDLARLSRWVVRAALAVSADEVAAEP